MQDVLVFLGALTLMVFIGVGVGVPVSMLTLRVMDWCARRRCACWKLHGLHSGEQTMCPTHGPVAAPVLIPMLDMPFYPTEEEP